MISYNRFKHTTYFTGPGWLKAYHQYGVVFVNHKEGGTRPAAASDKVCQLLAHGRWFSLGTPGSSTTKTGRYDIAESSVKHNKSINLILL